MKTTRKQLIESGIELFSSKAFDEVSISEVCKTAELSNGIFYKYFENKEEFYKELLKEAIDRIEAYLLNIEGETIKERLKDFIKKNLNLTKKEFKLIKIYRDGQYKFLEFEKEIKLVYNKALEKIYERKISIYEHFFIMSPIRFINIYYISRELEPDIDFLVKVLLYGFLHKTKKDISSLDEGMFYLRVPFNSSNMKCKILNVSTEMLSTQKYSSITVNDITERVGIAAGTFYLYFKNKDNLLKSSINRIKKQVLYFLKDCYNPEETPLDNHIKFLYLLFEYYKDSSFKYKLIREIEMIDNLLYQRCLDNEVELYLDTLENLNCNYERRRVIAIILLGIAHYMGIECFYLKSFSDRKEFLENIKYFLQNGIEN
ncbi:TetR/AcrR family transcriptional regulator [Fusobacterium sp. oral taxon 203]|jgi:transcriptional regulator, tetR family|uniref:TetR/AcrR family transcriptional regulator n=1 Tax=Fusobacterium sp. oral taxon 203 TaxID=671211 RepID=UPI000B927EA3|nr:TetR/AcrR family transcriptional regulator [Fusobacterium sp. oral taxon 203]ASS40062.1 TetR family transcriptional regulator [Fusobacterium sp. oral taxon 203]